MSTVDRVSLVGVGKMGEAFLIGLLRSGYDSNLLMICDSDGERVKEIVNKYNVKGTISIGEATSWGEVIFIAVKPKDVVNVLSQMVGCAQGKIIVSFAAGVALEQISKFLKNATCIIRAMPNLACRVRQGVIAVSKGILTEDGAYRRAISLLRKTGDVYEVDEESIDIATGLTGSGPAYVCYFIESLRDAGSKLGLDENTSAKMVLQLLYGTSKLLLEEVITPEGLRNLVTTPGGTTAKGLEVFNECGFKVCVTRAIEMATQRAKEIAQEFKRSE
ncbi:MAG: pyrroline-5-carboxylate reductase [Candidatus Bathyarchaeia archaeon]